MIGYLKGKIISLEENSVILNVNNIGFKVTMPVCELEKEKENNEIEVYTYLHVREDCMDLYGSHEKKTIELFKKLIDVSGIGPKVAMGILSKLDANDVIYAILRGDTTTIVSCPGVGKKTAERLVLELRDKLLKTNTLTEINEKEDKEEKSEVKKEAFEALVNLGYKRQDAKSIVDKTYESGMTLEDLIRKALTR